MRAEDACTGCWGLAADRARDARQRRTFFAPQNTATLSTGRGPAGAEGGPRLEGQLGRPAVIEDL